MEAMRQSWSDDRLDHLNAKVDAGFALVDEKFKLVDRRFEQVGGGLLCPLIATLGGLFVSLN